MENVGRRPRAQNLQPDSGIEYEFPEQCGRPGHRVVCGDIGGWGVGVCGVEVFAGEAGDVGGVEWDGIGVRGRKREDGGEERWRGREGTRLVVLWVIRGCREEGEGKEERRGNCR